MNNEKTGTSHRMCRFCMRLYCSQKLLYSLFDCNCTSDSHTNHRVVACAGLQKRTENNGLFTLRINGFCVLNMRFHTCVDKMWTRICPHPLYHIMLTLSITDFQRCYFSKNTPIFAGHTDGGTIKPAKCVFS